MLLRPQIGTNEHMPSPVGSADDFAPIVEGRNAANRATECAEIDHPASLPEEWINRWHSGSRIWRSVGVGSACNLTTFVDEIRVGIVPAQCAQILHYPVLPQERTALGGK